MFSSKDFQKELLLQAAIISRLAMDFKSVSALVADNTITQRLWLAGRYHIEDAWFRLFTCCQGITVSLASPGDQSAHRVCCSPSRATVRSRTCWEAHKWLPKSFHWPTAVHSSAGAPSRGYCWNSTEIALLGDQIPRYRALELAPVWPPRTGFAVFACTQAYLPKEGSIVMDSSLKMPTNLQALRAGISHLHCTLSRISSLRPSPWEFAATQRYRPICRRLTLWIISVFSCTCTLLAAKSLWALRSFAPRVNSRFSNTQPISPTGGFPATWHSKETLLPSCIWSCWMAAPNETVNWGVTVWKYTKY